MDNKQVGLYIHVPFCRSKCPYCDFYSLAANDETKAEYIDKVCGLLKSDLHTFDTVYFGGGTPSQLGAKAVADILACVSTTERPEITLECNPSDCLDGGFDFALAASAGVNRISMGLQSANDAERRALGRRTDSSAVREAFDRARQAGIDNISLDLMIGTPLQTICSLLRSAEFCIALGAKHISAYMLKIEAGTGFYNRRNELELPDEDTVCDMYLALCGFLREHGYAQYEVSNFALPGFESRHNLKYWRCEEYIGIGPAAHSFLDGRRFYYPRDLGGFIAGNAPADDGEGGSFEEYAMLALRLSEGLIFSNARERFGNAPVDAIIKKAQAPILRELVNISDKNISLTERGFLLSNSVIAELV